MPETYKQKTVRLQEPVDTQRHRQQYHLDSQQSKMSVRSDNSLNPNSLLKRGPVQSRKSVARSTTSSEHDAVQPQNKNATSLYSLMAARQLARRFVSRFRQERGIPEEVVHAKPPTYQLKPRGRFDHLEVNNAIKKVVEPRMRTFRYTPSTANILCKLLTSECKDAVHKLDYDRFKIVVHVTIGEKKGQELSLSSQCVWDASCDNMSKFNWESSTAFCAVVVFGVYAE